jgi:hypothetical protein
MITLSFHILRPFNRRKIAEHFQSFYLLQTSCPAVQQSSVALTDFCHTDRDGGTLHLLLWQFGLTVT